MNKLSQGTLPKLKTYIVKYASIKLKFNLCYC